MKEIKGIITIDGVVAITCCYKCPNVLIDGNSLYDFIENIDYFDTLQVRYVILPKRPNKNTSFEQLAGQVVTEMLYSDRVYGCYSEWTCGDGWDYLLGEGGHSILEELATHEGKYVHLIM